MKQILWQMMFNSLDIITQIIYICDFVNKINNAQIYVWMYKKNKVKFIDQMNAQWLTQNWSRLVFDTKLIKVSVWHYVLKIDFTPHTIQWCFESLRPLPPKIQWSTTRKWSTTIFVHKEQKCVCVSLSKDSYEWMKKLTS